MVLRNGNILPGSPRAPAKSTGRPGPHTAYLCPTALARVLQHQLSRLPARQFPRRWQFPTGDSSPAGGGSAGRQPKACCSAHGMAQWGNPGDCKRGSQQAWCWEGACLRSRKPRGPTRLCVPSLCLEVSDITWLQHPALCSRPSETFLAPQMAQHGSDGTQGTHLRDFSPFSC